MVHVGTYLWIDMQVIRITTTKAQCIWHCALCNASEALLLPESALLCQEMIRHEFGDAMAAPDAEFVEN